MRFPDKDRPVVYGTIEIIKLAELQCENDYRTTSTVFEMWFLQWNSKFVNKGWFAMTPFFLVQSEYLCVFLLFSALSKPWSSNW